MNRLREFAVLSAFSVVIVALFSVVPLGVVWVVAPGWRPMIVLFGCLLVLWCGSAAVLHSRRLDDVAQRSLVEGGCPPPPSTSRPTLGRWWSEDPAARRTQLTNEEE